MLLMMPPAVVLFLWGTCRRLGVRGVGGVEELFVGELKTTKLFDEDFGVGGGLGVGRGMDAGGSGGGVGVIC